jgi:DNA end-binding protein Ku
MGTLLRYPYEVRSADEYFDEIQDVKVTKDMLDLAKHIVNRKSGRFEPDKFEDQYETALVELINQKRSGKPIVPKERPRGENVVDLMEALRRSVGGAAAELEVPKKGAKKPRKAAAGQKEMLMPIAGKKPAKETATKKPTAKPQRKSAQRPRWLRGNRKAPGSSCFEEVPPIWKSYSVIREDHFGKTRMTVPGASRRV